MSSSSPKRPRASGDWRTPQGPRLILDANYGSLLRSLDSVERPRMYSLSFSLSFSLPLPFSIHVCMYIYIYIHLYVHKYLSGTCVCIYIYIYVYTYKYISIQMYVYSTTVRPCRIPEEIRAGLHFAARPVRAFWGLLLPGSCRREPSIY